MTYIESVLELEKHGIITALHFDLFANSLRITLSGAGTPRSHAICYPSVKPKDLEAAAVGTLQCAVVAIFEMSEEELRRHSWWEWVQQNKEWAQRTLIPQSLDSVGLFDPHPSFIDEFGTSKENTGHFGREIED